MSDMLGLVGKSALERYVASNPDFTGRDAEAVAAAMRARLSPATTQFHSIKVVVVPVLERPPKGMGVVVPHIQKMRHITLTPTGTLVARELACHEKGLLSLPGGVEERGAAPHHPAVH